MKNESRTLKSIKNAQVSMFYYFVQLILGFWSRKVFLDYLGVDILGLDTTAAKLFGFLNLAELGVGMAVTYFLYKPLNDNNYEEINKIVALQGWIYRRVAAAIIVGAIILMAFFPWIFADITLPLWYAYATFSMMLYCSMLGYFINYKSIVLNADQKGYKVSRTTQGFGVFIKILQILLLPIVPNPFIFYLTTSFASYTFGCLWLNYVIRKEYPWLKTKGYKGKTLLKEYPDIMKKTGQLFIHRLTSAILFEGSPLIIYAFSSLAVVGSLGNYTNILDRIMTIISMVFSSMGAAIGSLIATGDKQHVVRVFWELYDSRFCIAAISMTCVFFLAHPFIALWIGEQYIMGELLLSLLLINVFIRITRLTVDHYINGYGLFQDVWAPAVEGCINIVGSIVFGLLFGYKGVLMGSILSQLIIVLAWKPYMLFNKGLQIKPSQYFTPVIIRHFVLLLDVFILYFLFKLCIPERFTNFIQFIPYALLMSFVITLVIVGEFWFFSQGVRDFFLRLLGVIKGRYSK